MKIMSEKQAQYSKAFAVFIAVCLLGYVVWALSIHFYESNYPPKQDPRRETVKVEPNWMDSTFTFSYVMYYEGEGKNFNVNMYPITNGEFICNEEHIFISGTFEHGEGLVEHPSGKWEFNSVFYSFLTGGCYKFYNDKVVYRESYKNKWLTIEYHR